jgi:anaerobic magnesium-protoporphyrin IX monomethyl ester cyclase
MRILFVNLPSALEVYKKTNVRAVTPSYPNLSIATIAGNLPGDVKAKVIDLDFFEDFVSALKEKIKSFKPDFIGMEIKTVTFNAAEIVSGVIRENYTDIRIIAGGVHVTTFATDLLKTNYFDFLVIGEGDYALNKIFNNEDDFNILDLKVSLEENIKKIENFSKTKSNPKYTNINDIAFPKWDMFDITKYYNSRLTARANPVGLIETSRGCAFQCNFCNKNTFGSFYRTKAAERVVEEFRYLKKVGFREIHIIDDSFTQDLNRAKEICERLIKIGFDLPWSMFSGVRVDKVDKEFFSLAKRAGAWSVSFGIESGNQEILDRIRKKTKIAQIEKAVKAAVNEGLNTFGFFIIGLSGDTEKSVMDTINFAVSLPLDIAKFDICIPYPGTSFYKELDEDNRLLTKDWSKYIVHQTDSPLFIHPNLTWEQLSYYYKLSYKKYFFRPKYILKRFVRDIKMGDLLFEAKYFFTSILNA